jgi:RNA polymerase sigma factor (sigma-70 family)
LVDDHLSFRQSLAFLLGREPDLEVVGEAGSLAEARPLLGTADVALIDLDLPDGNGVDLIRQLHAASPRANAVVLTAGRRLVDLGRAVEAGAAGTLHKSLPVAEVVAALRRLVAGEHLTSPTETVELLRLAGRQRERDRVAEQAIARLTRREREVLQALAEGLSDRTIAERLNVQPETVRTHMVNLLAKLEADSRLQALVFAVRHGLVTID